MGLGSVGVHFTLPMFVYDLFNNIFQNKKYWKTFNSSTFHSIKAKSSQWPTGPAGSAPVSLTSSPQPAPCHCTQASVLRPTEHRPPQGLSPRCPCRLCSPGCGLANSLPSRGTSQGSYCEACYQLPPRWGHLRPGIFVPLTERPHVPE